MERVARGGKQAFLELMERWQGGLFRFFSLLGACDHEAEDSVQETFLRVFAYRFRYRRTAASFRSFLFHVARNVSVDMARKRRRRAGWLSLETCEEAERGGADPTLAWNDRLDVRSALLALPEKLRVVVVLNTFEGMSYREVAETLGIPLGTVKSRMHHALVRLREVLHVDHRE